MKKEFNILKKPYLPPRVEFEEIEADEREMLLAPSYGGVNQGGNTGGEGTNDPWSTGLDVSFEEPTSESTSSPSDFIINDEY